MSRLKKKTSIMFRIAGAALFFMALIPIVSSAIQHPAKPDEFILPEWGGAMVHSDPHLSDYINLPVPTSGVRIVWNRNELLSEQSGTRGNGIAGNKKIAACPFGALLGIDNLVIYDYNGTRLWRSGSLLNVDAQTSTPMVDKYNRVIACDNRHIMMIDPDYNDDGEYVWREDIPGIAAPLSPTITDNGVIILPTAGGPLHAFNSQGGELLGSKTFGLYSSKNSACVNGNRVYLLVSRSLIDDSRLYAIDIDPGSSDPFHVVWYYSFQGKSQASPTFINGTLYFDAYKGTGSNPQVYAVTDKGTYASRKWRATCEHTTAFSMSYDPRGGIWYEDHEGRKLIRFNTANGSIIEQISMDSILGETGFVPMSVMEVCGSSSSPIMIVSANKWFQKYYVMAIRLNQNANSLLWKVEINSLFNCNYAGGQYTILTDNYGSNPRVLFGAYWGGVIALGK